MLLKISLGLAILAGLAALYVTHFQVAEKIQTITQQKDEFEKKSAESAADATKSRAEAKASKTQLESTKKELAEKTTNLETETARRQEQQKRADQYAQDLTKTTEDRNEAQRDLAAWKSLGLPIEAIRTQRDELRKSNDQRDAFAEENRILLRNNNQLKADLARYQGGAEVEVKLPAGLKGKIIAVDPKYDFVVLDIGGNQGVLENGRMLVNRNGKLIAKVRVTTVEPNRSIANIMPEFRLDEVMEGDQVLY